MSLQWEWLVRKDCPASSWECKLRPKNTGQSCRGMWAPAWGLAPSSATLCLSFPTCDMGRTLTCLLGLSGGSKPCVLSIIHTTVPRHRAFNNCLLYVIIGTGTSWGSVVRNSRLCVPRAQVRSLGEELKSHKLCAPPQKIIIGTGCKI